MLNVRTRCLDWSMVFPIKDPFSSAELAEAGLIAHAEFWDNSVRCQSRSLDVRLYRKVLVLALGISIDQLFRVRAQEDG